jgi:ABC-type sugar transport system permease subunit
MTDVSTPAAARATTRRGFVRAAVMVPYITPPAVVGLLFVFTFDGNFGVVNDLFVRMGLLDNYVA